MKTKSAAPSGQLTLMIFRDNYASRIFKVPLRWVSNLGLLLGLTGLIALAAVYMAVKYFQEARLADPSHAIELERRLGEVTAAYKNLSEKYLDRPAATTPAPAPPVTKQTGQPATTAGSPPQTLADPLGRPLVLAPVGGGAVFSSIPGNVKISPEAAKPSIELREINLRWFGSTLRVRFNIQYVATDGSNQTGRVILIARGPGTLMTYPNNILNNDGAEVLINPSRGEFFSVSRLRPVTAKFGPNQSTEAIKNIRILVLDQNGDLLINNRLTVKDFVKKKEATKAQPIAVDGDKPAEESLETEKPEAEATEVPKKTEEAAAEELKEREVKD